jgi:hypothetical protein
MDLGTKSDEQLNEYFSKTKNLIHDPLCHSIDTSSVMKYISQLLSKTHAQMNQTTVTVNFDLLTNIAKYISFLINTFGINDNVAYGEDIGYESGPVNSRSRADIHMSCIEESASSGDAVPKPPQAVVHLVDQGMN